MFHKCFCDVLYCMYHCIHALPSPSNSSPSHGWCSLLLKVNVLFLCSFKEAINMLKYVVNRQGTLWHALFQECQTYDLLSFNTQNSHFHTQIPLSTAAEFQNSLSQHSPGLFLSQEALHKMPFYGPIALCSVGNHNKWKQVLTLHIMNYGNCSDDLFYQMCLLCIK